MATGKAAYGSETDALPADAVTPLRVDCDELSERGYVTVPRAVAQPRLLEFHATVQELTVALGARHRLPTRGTTPLLPLLRRGGAYRTQLFSLLKNLHVVQRMSLELVERLRAGGLWARMGMRVPLAWPTLRADPPDEDTYLLPMHQDYGSTRCHVALRGWVPLTPANEEHGTMSVVVGSHKLGFLEHDTSDPAYPRVAPVGYQHLPLHTLTCEPGSLVLFHPALVHGSVANRGTCVKFVLLLQMQDLATMVDPDDTHDPMHSWIECTRAREHARTAVPGTSD
jgi:hypothetical protein